MAIYDLRHRLASLFGQTGRGTRTQCTHETDDLWPQEDAQIWELTDSHLDEESYLSEMDAAFVYLRRRVREYKCLGCGEETAVSTGERIGDPLWKEEMTANEIRQMREEAVTGSWFNGLLWWETNVWNGGSDSAAMEVDASLQPLVDHSEK